MADKKLSKLQKLVTSKDGDERVKECKSLLRSGAVPDYGLQASYAIRDKQILCIFEMIIAKKGKYYTDPKYLDIPSFVEQICCNEYHSSKMKTIQTYMDHLKYSWYFPKQASPLFFAVSRSNFECIQWILSKSTDKHNAYKMIHEIPTFSYKENYGYWAAPSKYCPPISAAIERFYELFRDGIVEIYKDQKNNSTDNKNQKPVKRKKNIKPAKSKVVSRTKQQEIRNAMQNGLKEARNKLIKSDEDKQKYLYENEKWKLQCCILKYLLSFGADPFQTFETKHQFGPQSHSPVHSLKLNLILFIQNRKLDDLMNVVKQGIDMFYKKYENNILEVVNNVYGIEGFAEQVVPFIVRNMLFGNVEYRILNMENTEDTVYPVMTYSYNKAGDHFYNPTAGSHIARVRPASRSSYLLHDYVQKA
eukprot:72245_1